MDIVRNSLGSEIRIIWNSIDATYKNAFWLVMVFSLLAWGAELVNHTDNVDDYIQSMIHSPMVWTQLGRWGADILYFYGLGGWYMPTLHLLIGLIVNTSTILIAIYYFSHGRKTSLSNIVLPAGLYVTFPYLTDVFGFNTAQVLIPLSNLLVICGYILARKELFPFLISALSMTLAASLYQISLNTLTIAIVSHLMFLLVYSGSFSPIYFLCKR